MKKILRDPFSSISHGIGIIISIIFLILMLFKLINNDDVINKSLIYVSVIVFCLSSMLLYAASSVYHGVRGSDKLIYILRKLDHSMIFILIAGSYTPFCLLVLPKSSGIPLLICVWSIAVAGILFKMLWFKCPRILSTLLYVFMGWLAIFVIKPIVHSLPLAALLLLVLGGIMYTVGGVIYGIKRPSLKFIDFHDIFHVFTLLGTTAHLLLVYIFIC